MMELFDKGLTVRMGQCHVRRWSDELLDIVRTDEDVLGLEGLATHRAGLDDAPDLYRVFQEKQDECLKVVLTPCGTRRPSYAAPIHRARRCR